MTRELLYITRKYPPSKGGMQRLSKEIYEQLAGRCKCELIAWGGSQWFLPLFFMMASVRASLVLLTNRSISTVLLGDALLAPLGVLLKLIYRKRVLVILNGLDLTYAKYGYQHWLVPLLRRLDGFICISESTKSLSLNRGIPADRSFVVPLGVHPRVATELSKAEIRKLLSLDPWLSLGGRSILLTVGRLVRRKGVSWFIEEILPTLVKRDAQVLYIVAGGGPEEHKIKTLIRELSLEQHCALLGAISEERLNQLYLASDIFVMPNIEVKGDVEGFGLVALEAGAAGLCVVAARLEGISDAVQDGVNGLLLESGDAESWIDTIGRLLSQPDESATLGSNAKSHCRVHRTWDRVGDAFERILLEEPVK